MGATEIHYPDCIQAQRDHLPIMELHDQQAARRDLERTRRNKLRLGEELELNFFYHHFLRVERFPVVAMRPSHVRFTYAQRCAGEGELRCARALVAPNVDFATFNDDATSTRTLQLGLATLHRLLRVRFGSFT